MIERSFLFGRNGNLVGTLCLPDQANKTAAPATAGILLFNAGIVSRIGPHRINVRIARRLAGMGIASLRFDLAGLGDSVPAGAAASFEQQAVADLQDAVGALAAATGLARFGLFGFCSGAFHSVNAAVADPRITAVLLFEAYRYGTVQSRMRRRLQRVRQQGFFQPVLRVAGRMLQRLGMRFSAGSGATPAASAKAARQVSGSGYIADSPTAKARFARDAAALLARGVGVSMVFAGDGLEIYNYAGQFADAFRGFGITQDIAVTFLRDIDHVATATASQVQLAGTVCNWAAACAGVETDVFQTDASSSSVTNATRQTPA